MKDSTRICILVLFSAIWICKPIPYESLAYRIHQREQTISKICLVNRSGSKGNSSNFDPTFHSRLVEHFPDWNERIAYQQKQEKFYKSAMRKERDIKRLRLKEHPSFYTKEELDARDYFQGTGFYKKYQDPKTKPNIYDTRQSFLRKMHDPTLRENFLNSFNRRNN